MELHARLVHAETGLRVVEVRASRGEQSLGSSLAEAPTAQEAEDLATARLLHRLEAAAAPPPKRSVAELPAPAQVRAVRPLPLKAAAAPPTAQGADPSGPPTEQGLPRSGAVPTAPPQRQPPESPVRPGGEPAAGEPDPAIAKVREQNKAPLAPVAGDEGPAPIEPVEEPPADPEDWSQELTAVDLQLRRLGWSREQEGLYLQRAFGHPSRTRLTRYSDLRAYLVALEGLQPGSDAALAAVPLRRSELLAQGDALLRQLGWSAEQGRSFLERQLQRTSRQQLSDVQLLEFNMLLEGELLAVDPAAAATAPEEAQR